MRLKDKVAIITGGAHGMGECEARLFAQEGAKVVIADVLAAEGEALAADICAGQAQARFVRTDVTVEADWARLIEAALAAYGRLDILVNNAGISGSSVGDHDGLDGWNRIIAVNATSVYIGTKRAAAAMAKTGGGSIVNISSIMGLVGGRGGAPRLPRLQGGGAQLHQGGGVPVRAARRAGEFCPSGLSAADAERDQRGRAAGEDRGDAAAPAWRGDRCRLWRAVSGVRRGVVRHRRGAGDRRRLRRAVRRASGVVAVGRRFGRGW